jgi:ATP-binding cassette, subfamily F, member 3
MTRLDVHNIHKTFGAHPILSGLSFKVEDGDKVGIIGENGSGKSTLLKLITGEEPPDEGTIAKPKGTKIGYISQVLEIATDRTVLDEVWSALSDLTALESRLRTAEQSLSSPDLAANPEEMEKALARYSKLQAEFETKDGYAAQTRVDTIIDGLGLTRKRDQSIDTLSGGEKNIVALARTLVGEPDIILLDEPANHLDFEGLDWLEDFLQSYPKALILVSHNRYLLDRTVNRILEIENRRVTPYIGNYSAYRVEKMRNLLKQKQAYEDQQKEIARLEVMIKQFAHWAHITSDKAHAIRTRSRRKYLDRMEKIDQPVLDGDRINPDFDVQTEQGRIALELNDYSRQIGDRTLFEAVTLHLAYGDRVGFIGANGTGKSTLFRDIVDTADWGNRTLRIGPRTNIGYYAQEHDTLDFSKTVLEEIRLTGGLSRDEAQVVLGRYLFGRREVDKVIGTLSGGEKSRVQLAKLAVQDVNFLLMDEPTNHLDIPSRERIEEGLESFAGTLFVISHDRYFLDRIVDRIVEIDTPGITEFAGNFSAYWEDRRTIGHETNDSVSPDIEHEIDKLEREKQKLEATLAEAYRNAAYKKGDRISREIKRVDRRIEGLYGQL